MSKLIISLPLIIIMLAISISAEPVWDPLTVPRGDARYCMIDGDCSVNNLTAKNFTVANITVINMAIIANESWVNESGDTMTGDLIHQTNIQASTMSFLNDTNDGNYVQEVTSVNTMRRGYILSRLNNFDTNSNTYTHNALGQFEAYEAAINPSARFSAITATQLFNVSNTGTSKYWGMLFNFGKQADATVNTAETATFYAFDPNSQSNTLSGRIANKAWTFYYYYLRDNTYYWAVTSNVDFWYLYNDFDTCQGADSGSCNVVDSFLSKDYGNNYFGGSGTAPDVSFEFNSTDWVDTAHIGNPRHVEVGFKNFTVEGDAEVTGNIWGNNVKQVKDNSTITISLASKLVNGTHATHPVINATNVKFTGTTVFEGPVRGIDDEYYFNLPYQSKIQVLTYDDATTQIGYVGLCEAGMDFCEWVAKCPYVYYFDGETYNVINDLFPSVSSYSDWLDFGKKPDYLVIKHDIPSFDGKIKFKLKELNEEFSYIDSFNVYAVNTNNDLAVNMIDNSLIEYNDIHYPQIVKTNYGDDVSSHINSGTDSINWIDDSIDNYFNWQDYRYKLPVYLDYISEPVSCEEGKPYFLISTDACSYSLSLIQDGEYIQLHDISSPRDLWNYEAYELPLDDDKDFILRIKRRTSNPKIKDMLIACGKPIKSAQKLKVDFITYDSYDVSNMFSEIDGDMFHLGEKEQLYLSFYDLEGNYKYFIETSGYYQETDFRYKYLTDDTITEEQKFEVGGK